MVPKDSPPDSALAKEREQLKEKIRELESEIARKTKEIERLKQAARPNPPSDPPGK